MPQRLRKLFQNVANHQCLFWLKCKHSKKFEKNSDKIVKTVFENYSHIIYKKKINSEICLPSVAYRKIFSQELPLYP